MPRIPRRRFACDRAARFFRLHAAPPSRRSWLAAPNPRDRDPYLLAKSISPCQFRRWAASARRIRVGYGIHRFGDRRMSNLSTVTAYCITRSPIQFSRLPLDPRRPAVSPSATLVLMSRCHLTHDRRAQRASFRQRARKKNATTKRTQASRLPQIAKHHNYKADPRASSSHAARATHPEPEKRTQRLGPAAPRFPPSPREENA